MVGYHRQPATGRSARRQPGRSPTACHAVTKLADQLREEAAQKRAWQRRHQTRRMLSASFRGYFWMPCPLCGEEFGGNEWVNRISLPGSEPGMSTGVCPACELDLGVAALPMCEQQGHRPVWILSEASATIAPSGEARIDLPIDLDAPPLRAYCQVCGLDLPV